MGGPPSASIRPPSLSSSSYSLAASAAYWIASACSEIVVTPSEPAFTEGNWKAVPVWFAIGRGENLALAEWLMKRGADPNHSFWAASFRNDLAAERSELL